MEAEKSIMTSRSASSSIPSDASIAAYAVIIPHYNDVARLEKCLCALFASEGEGILADVEVVVVDNSSTDSLVEIRAAFPNARFVIEPRKGAAAARNRGVRETTAPALFFLDADCVPATDWLLEAKRAIRAPNADLIGGRIDTFDETPPPRSGAEAFETVFAFRQKAYVDTKGFSVTANLLTTRPVFENTGDFIVGLSEDVDWCWRARAKGYRLIYDDKVVVSHPTRQDWPALLKKWRRMVDEGFLLNGKGGIARLKWAMRALGILISAFIHAPKVIMHEDLRSSKERWRGVITLFLLRFWRCSRMLHQALATRNKSE